jgi:MFS family permease
LSFPDDTGVSAAKRWSMLAISLTATLSANVFINAIAFLIPAMNAQRGTGLATAGLLASMPNFGTMVTLIGWGYLLDVIGERFVLAVGLALTAAAALAAASSHSMVLMGIFLFLGGMAAASTITASGRLVTGWFTPQQRGLAMGIRQTAQPLGIAVGAIVLPELGKHNFSAALVFPAVACALSAVACAVGVHDPPRPPRAEADEGELENPYLKTAALWRIHLASALLMVPQPVVLTFMLVWATRQHGFSIAWAGALMGFSQLLGALARTAADRVADASAAADRRRHLGGPTVTGARRPTSFANCLGGHGHCAGDHRRQRPAVHQRAGDRRTVLERARPGHPEHRRADDRRGRAAGIRRSDHRDRLSARLRGVRTISVGRVALLPGVRQPIRVGVHSIAAVNAPCLMA